MRNGAAWILTWDKPVCIEQRHYKKWQLGKLVQLHDKTAQKDKTRQERAPSTTVLVALSFSCHGMCNHMQEILAQNGTVMVKFLSRNCAGFRVLCPECSATSPSWHRCPSWGAIFSLLSPRKWPARNIGWCFRSDPEIISLNCVSCEQNE